MSAKTNAEVVIDGKVYTLSGYENEEYLQKVAAYINNKIAEFDDMDEYKHLPGNMKSTLIELNIADDYFKAKALVEKLEGDIENKDKEIYDLKHDLISNQVKTKNAVNNKPTTGNMIFSVCETALGGFIRIRRSLWVVSKRMKGG